MPPSRFAVGDRAEYWSDTYQQWMPGTIQRVREGGAAYDLDVKKGAQASKLRLARSPAAAQDSDGLFSIVDSNHDGIISRSEFQGALQSHVIEGVVAPATARSFGVVPLPLPPAEIVRNKSSSQPAQPVSARGCLSVRPEAGEQPLQRRRPASRDPEALSQLRRRAEAAGSAAAALERSTAAERLPLQEARSKSPRSTALQARQIHTELATVTRAVQGQTNEWAETAGQDMVSRAGAVTVRKMVETTKALLQGLEGALILRAGFIAGCFHMWRCETTLSHANQLYQEEFKEHHDQWVAHLDHHRRSFEAEVRAHAQRAVLQKQRHQQQNALLLDTWAHGERQGLIAQSLRAWRTHTGRQKRMKITAARIHKSIFTWAEGESKGLVHSSFSAWLHAHTLLAELRKKEADLDKLHGSYKSRLEEQQKLHDQLMQDRLGMIEAAVTKGRRDIEVVIAKWERGNLKGTLTMVLQAWSGHLQKLSATARRSAVVDMELRRWAEGKARGDTHCAFVRWKMLAVQSSLERRHQAALEAERENLQKMLTDQEKGHQKALQQQLTEAEKLRQRNRNAVDVAVSRWSVGDTKGLMCSVLRAWKSWATQAKRLGHQRQSVHSVLVQSLRGSRKGVAHLALLNWSGLAKSEKHARQLEERAQMEAQRWQTFLAESEQEHEAKLGEMRDSIAAEKDKAHAAMGMMLQKWAGGDAKGLQAALFTGWKQLRERGAEKERRRNAVKASVLRFVEGENLSIAHSVFQGWKGYALWEAKHSRLHSEREGKIVQLERQVKKMLRQNEARLPKYGEMLASNRAVALKGLCLSVWRDEAKGLKGELEAQRQEAVRLEEMARAHKRAETLHQEWKCRTVEAMGYKGSRVVLLESFLAWSYYVQQEREKQVQSVNHNELLLHYSSFVIRQKLSKDSGTLLASCFAEWHRESQILFHQRSHEHAQRSMEETRSYMVQLESQRSELQDQLSLYYQQIDLITETLQKELKTKEELAMELRSAYSKMRKTNFTPTTAASDRAANDVGGLSRTSSDQTLDQVVTTPHLTPTTPAAANAWRLGISAPKSPSVLKCGELLRGEGRNNNNRDGSLSPCGWDRAVERMSEEGMVRLEKRDT